MMNGLYHLFISTASTNDRVEGAILRALSVDGVRYVLRRGTISPGTPYESGGSIVMWRDPFIVHRPALHRHSTALSQTEEESEEESWFMFVTASLRFNMSSVRSLKCWLGVEKIGAGAAHAPAREDFCSYDTMRGCVALASAREADASWQLQGPAADIRVPHRWGELGDTAAFTEMERPQVSAA